MHETLCPNVKGCIDVCKKLEISDESFFLKGWCFHEELGVLPLRINNGSSTEILLEETRDDVAIYYANTFNQCGWSFVTLCSTITLEMKINEWVPILTIKTKMEIEYSNRVPSFIVVDHFYKNPDTIREFALHQTFSENANYHKGKRAIHPQYRFPGLKEQFESILGTTILNWDKYDVNGCFQYCIAEDKAVYHCDLQSYAGIIYLTPDAPPQTGTSFYRSKRTKKMKTTDDGSIVFKHGHYDSTQFDLVDTVGNVYNRLILFDARMIHAAPQYFGNDMQNGRLFQLFFFDI